MQASTIPFTLWSVNKKKLLINYSIPALVFVLVPAITQEGKNSQEAGSRILCFAGFMFLITFLLSIVPIINSFTVIKRLINDHSETSVLPLFDAGYTIEPYDKKSWVYLTVPCLKATIHGFPVRILFNPAARGNGPAYIGFSFSPLSIENSKRVYRKDINFTMRFTKRLKKDVKPQILALVESIKKEDLTSGADRSISTTHYDVYAD